MEPGTESNTDRFARYYNGLMSPAEMHQLEKEALEDPILNAMMEGYRHTHTAAVKQQLQQIEDQVLKHASQQRKIIPLMSYLKAAAACVLITAAGILFWKIHKNETGPGVAATRSTIKKRVGDTDLYALSPSSLKHAFTFRGDISFPNHVPAQRMVLTDQKNDSLTITDAKGRFSFGYRDTVIIIKTRPGRHTFTLTSSRIHHLLIK